MIIMKINEMAELIHSCRNPLKGLTAIRFYLFVRAFVMRKRVEQTHNENMVEHPAEVNQTFSVKERVHYAARRFCGEGCVFGQRLG